MRRQLHHKSKDPHTARRRRKIPLSLRRSDYYVQSFKGGGGGGGGEQIKDSPFILELYLKDIAVKTCIDLESFTANNL